MVRTLIPRLSDPAKIIQPSDWATYWGDIINDYVIGGFGVVLAGSTVTIEVGRARIRGLYLENDEEQTIEVSDGDYVGILITESSGEASSWDYATNDDESSLDMVFGRRDGSSIVDLRQVVIFKSSAIYGDGSDGNVIIDSDTMLTRDMQYWNLTITEGVTVTADLPSIMIRVLGRCVIRGKIVCRNGAIGGSGGSANSHGIVGSNGYGQGGDGGKATGGDSGSGQGVINRQVETSDYQDEVISYPINHGAVLNGGVGGFEAYFVELDTIDMIRGRNAIRSASGGGGGAGACNGASADSISLVSDSATYSSMASGGDGGIAMESGGAGGRGGGTLILVAREVALYDTAEIDVRGEDGGDGVNDLVDGGDGESDVGIENTEPSVVTVSSQRGVSCGGGGGSGSSGSGGGGAGGIVYIAYDRLVEDGDIDVRVDGGDSGSLSSDAGGDGGDAGSTPSISHGVNPVSTSGESGNVDLTSAERRGVNGEDGEYILTRVST